MDDDLLETFTKLGDSVFKDDWKKSLDSLFIALRKVFVFDNLAIYLVDEPGKVPEAVYARAVGRGRSQEAEASWGEEIANQVVATDKIVVRGPTGSSSSDRISRPHLLGLPFSLPTRNGVVVFVRFGGPEYAHDHLLLALLAVVQAARVFERRLMVENQAQLELARQRAQFQDDFIATVSHELHTPLGFIKGYTTSLLRSDTKWDVDTQREFLTIIDEESDHLVGLIDHMLDSARLQSGSIHMDFQPVRLDSLLRDVAMRFQNRNKTIKVVLEAAPTPSIKADIVRLTQVFDNLFDNAIKYAPGSKIKISIKQLKDRQIVTFADEGPGIPAESLPFLFERFYRVPGHPNKRGTGLGLFICKQIVQAHHGQITVQTAPGRGTIFVIELPVRVRKDKRKGYATGQSAPRTRTPRKMAAARAEK